MEIKEWLLIDCNIVNLNKKKKKICLFSSIYQKDRTPKDKGR